MIEGDYKCFQVASGILIVGLPEPLVVSTAPWPDGAPLEVVAAWFERMAKGLREAPAALNERLAQRAAAKETMS